MSQNDYNARSICFPMRPLLLIAYLVLTLALPMSASPVNAWDQSRAETRLAQAAPEMKTTDPSQPTVNAQPASSEARPVSIERAHLPRDLSPWGMFIAADIVVKVVMIGLALASVAVWTVWLAKSAELWLGMRSLRQAAREISELRTLDEAEGRLGNRRRLTLAFLYAARSELALSGDPTRDKSGIKERVASRLAEIEGAAGRSMRGGMGLMASVGATAPFIGLFGTVWGIMNSFIGISKAQTTNLAVVAPGIAEALLATAMGLVAAIPAVILYNQLARAIAGYRALLRENASEVERILSRELDRRDESGARPRARAAE